jgi:transposase InsO family protein
MAQKVAEMDVRMAAAIAVGPVNVAAYCRSAGISRQTFYKWRARFRAGGVPGLQPRSTAPRSRPGATPGEIEDLVIRYRKELCDAGKDHGPQSIRWKLEESVTAPTRPAEPGAPPAGLTVELLPSRSTIARILFRRGLVVPQPQKKPKSALRRFVFPRPNSCWQSDATEWHLRGGVIAAIAGTLDDHSRTLVGIGAATGPATGPLVWSVMTTAISEYGIPAASLTDNGAIYTARHRGGEADFEKNLHALGTITLNSRPFHPQTCGKIERFWQTLKKWLRARPAAATIADLNEQLTEFRSYYNHQRRHRALPGRCTPHQAYTATEPARPAARPIPTPVLVATRTVSSSGRVAAGRYYVALGPRWAGHTATVITDDDHITVFSGTTLIRELAADPNRRTQPLQTREPYRATRETPTNTPTTTPDTANSSRRRAT